MGGEITDSTRLCINLCICGVALALIASLIGLGREVYNTMLHDTQASVISSESIELEKIAVSKTEAPVAGIYSAMFKVRDKITNISGTIDNNAVTSMEDIKGYLGKTAAIKLTERGSEYEIEFYE